MYIMNLKTQTIQECSNADVIKMCKKHPYEYKLSDKREDFQIEDDVKDKEKNTNITKMKVDELKTLAAEYEIEDYQSLTKPELLEVLKDVVKDD